MRYFLALFVAALVIGFCAKGQGELPKCQKRISCTNDCHLEGTTYKQCKADSGSEKAVECKDGMGIPSSTQCGKIYTGSACQ